MSAKSEAIKKLGKEDDYINLAGFNSERTNAQNRYNTDYTNLQNKYNELVAQADRNKLAAKSDFNTSRLDVDRNAYMNTRGLTGADLSDRGLSEGFNAAGKFSSMLARNNASSDLANTYYNSMADIQRQMDIDTQDHNYNMNNLKLELDSTLANIGAREAAARNNYRTQVAQLAEQIQARWDANANATASLNAMKDQLNSQKNMEIYTRIKNIFDDKSLSTADKIKQASMLYTNLTGNSNGEGYLYNQGFITKGEYAPYITSPATGNATKKANTISNALTTYERTNRKSDTSSSSVSSNKYAGTNRAGYTSSAKSQPTIYSGAAQYSSAKPVTYNELYELWR